MWESLLQGTVGVLAAALVGLVGPFLLWQHRARKDAEHRRADALAEQVALVRARAFALAEAADRQLRLNPYYRPLVQLGEAIFALTAMLPPDGRGVAGELERRFGVLGEEIRQHRWRRWFPGGSDRVVKEALDIASCAQGWLISRNAATR